jgi:lipopolysaccharide transport system ATP-binding protein
LIVDEVLAVGDAAFQKKCLDKMKNVGEQGRTVLFVSHNMSAISRLCKRAVLLESGRVVMDGPVHDVVSTYLNSGQSTPPACEWPDLTTAPGNDIVRLRAVRIKNEDGEITSAVDVRQPVVIEMEYEVFTPDLTLLPHFTVNNQAGLCIFVGLDQDAKWRGRPRPIGKYVSRTCIPGNLLAEGTLFVGPAMRTVEPDMFHFGEQNAVAFEVIDGSTVNSARGDYVKSIPGVIRPLLKWSTQYEPNGSATTSTIKKGRIA